VCERVSVSLSLSEGVVCVSLSVREVGSGESINQPFIVLTETKFSYRYIPVWARYSPHRTRVEAHANMLSP
jgi:hypothetical protein